MCNGEGRVYSGEGFISFHKGLGTGFHHNMIKLQIHITKLQIINIFIRSESSGPNQS